MPFVRKKGGSRTAESTLTSKGQTTIPRSIRERPQVKPGDRMSFTLMPDGTVLLRIKNRSVMSLAGSLRKKSQRDPAGRSAVLLMRGLDTNVLVRFLVRDDEIRLDRARRLIQREAGRGEAVLISLLVLLETEWVLRSRYELAKNEIAGAFAGLLDSAELVLEDEASMEQALYLSRESPARFADCLIEARHWALECRGTASFDAGSLWVQRP